MTNACVRNSGPWVLKRDDARSMFRAMDLDCSGEVSVEEFIFGCMKMKGSAKSVDIVHLIHEGKRLKKHLYNMDIFLRSSFEQQQEFQAKLESILFPKSGPTNSNTKLQDLKVKSL